MHEKYKISRLGKVGKKIGKNGRSTLTKEGVSESPLLCVFSLVRFQESLLTNYTKSKLEQTNMAAVRITLSMTMEERKKKGNDDVCHLVEKVQECL